MKRAKPMNIYPELARLMAMKQMNQKDIANILHISQQSVSQKLKGIAQWRMSEMVKLREYFKDIDPELTMDKLFEIYLPG